MPNRKAFDEREKYDHSSHPVGVQQPSDLEPDVEQPGDRRVDRNPGPDAVERGPHRSDPPEVRRRRGSPERQKP